MSISQGNTGRYLAGGVVKIKQSLLQLPPPPPSPPTSGTASENVCFREEGERERKKKKERKEKNARVDERFRSVNVLRRYRWIRISRDFTVKSEEGEGVGVGSGSDSSNWILNPSIQARLRGFV